MSQPDEDDGRLAAEIEPLAVAAWPARETLSHDGWLLRFTDGFTHRGNSVATSSFTGRDTDAAIARAEVEYGKRGLAPMFQIATHVEPVDLAEVLVARGYAAVSPTFVRVTTPSRMLASLPPADAVTSESFPSDDFVGLVVEGSRSADDGRERIGILRRIDVPRVCVTAYTDGKAVACGTGTRSGDCVSVNLMRTHVEHRRTGHALRVLAGIAQWSAAEKARRVFLGVEMANAPAVALYAKAGFAPGYAYRYFRKI